MFHMKKCFVVMQCIAIEYFWCDTPQKVIFFGKVTRKSGEERKERNVFTVEENLWSQHIMIKLTLLRYIAKKELLE